MTTLRHEMILASAGSGKTYALTNRFVQLLAGGAAPERIVALTFTRKAAGEFFDEILKKLARAAVSEPAAAQLAREVGAPALGAADFLRMLRAMVDAMPRLNLGTLDGFFARIVRSFPLELGLSGEFRILEEATARRERRRVLRGMFAAGGEPDTAQREFIEAFKRATFGAEEKQLARLLDGYLDDHSDTYLAAPEAAQWGDPARIWPEGNPWLAAADRRDESSQALRAALPWAALNEKQRARLEDFFAALPEWQPGAPLPKPVDYLVGNAFKIWDELDTGADTVELMLERKKVPLDGRARAALTDVVAGIAGAELARRLAMTRGVFAVLSGYDRRYHEAVRREGRLTFADILRLLLPEGGRPTLATQPEADARLLIDWRLDAKFDHWLLDEFQDTSFAQWSVLRSLIDEAVQDPEQRRSLFYVGDVKQAIFAWRGGDPRLFREIFELYNGAGGDVIEERRLDRSYRSGPAVLAMVNRVFGDAAALRVSVPEATAAAWAKEWGAHVSAKPGLGGWAELRHAEDEAGRFAETLEILRETQALARGLTVAVLVRSNDTAAELADYLRQHGPVAAVAESDLHVATDNPLTCALLALLRAAAHPGDTVAQEHLNMTPLRALLLEEGLGSTHAVTMRLLGEIHEAGFAATLERWLRKCAPSLGGDAFSAERGRMLVGAATEFDESGSRDVAEFLEFAARYTVRDTESPGVVRVMTVHKSKGLGFDVVILPDLEGKTLAARRDGLAVQRAPDRSVEVITEPVGAKSTSKNFPRLLQEALGETWSEGDARWFDEIEIGGAGEDEAGEAGSNLAPAESGSATDTRLDEAATPRAVRRPARTPSAQKTGVADGAPLFALEGPGASAAEFGVELHATLAEVEWADTEATNRLAKAWAARGEAGAEAAACLGAPELAQVWAKPAAPAAEVWRERAFEVVLDGAWVTGVFDRVVVERDHAGVAVRATVFDFKTDRVAPDRDLGEAASRYSVQLDIYRRVVARFLGIAPAAVRGEIVFTRVRQRVAVAT
ncbi:MAG: UvrD-helicase domain-containing protein [Verrucomicrobia bacterium]|nr:UvrD-helicase domain-containing protein [Verrucomicrobiota bacterium]